LFIALAKAGACGFDDCWLGTAAEAADATKSTAAADPSEDVRVPFWFPFFLLIHSREKRGVQVPVATH
jgi:hypothetical protein